MQFTHGNRPAPGLFFLLLATVFHPGHAAAKTKIACIGNSITFGYGVNWDQAYPYRLQQLFGTEEYEVQNDGVNATTLLKNGDNPYYKNGKLPDAFNFQPDIITIKLGTNDSKPQNWDSHRQEFKGDLLWLIDTLETMATRPKLWLVLPVPVFDNPVGAEWGIRDSIIRKIIPIIKEAAEERDLPVIDMYEPLKPFPQYFSVDGVHPDAAGLDTIAHVIYRTLKEATGVQAKLQLSRSTLPSEKNHPVWVITLQRNRPDAAHTAMIDLSGRSIVCNRNAAAQGFPVFRWFIAP